MVRIAALVSHNVRLRLRDPAHLVSYLVMPMVLIPLFRPLYGEAAQPVTGLLVMFSVLLMADVAMATLSERLWHTWDRLRASGAGLAELVAGKALPVLAMVLAQQVVLILYGMAVLGLEVRSALWIPAVAAWSFALLGVGTALGTLVRSPGELSAVCNIAALAVSGLGGALVPVAMLPGWAQALAPLSPGYWATTGLKAALRGDPAGTAGPVGVLLAVGAAAWIVAWWRFKRGLA
ncbi:ABC transporter permease [Nonomuraea sp. NPDC050663]|uniref:ABC transporter permease n=1 Tax=Nonomuraea sp. NPDC050663 TaxID=3364370 RepID=UPI00378C0C24